MPGEISLLKEQDGWRRRVDRQVVHLHLILPGSPPQKCDL